MLKIKSIIMKAVFTHEELLAITENNKTIYFHNGKESTREKLNAIYKRTKEINSCCSLTIDKQEYIKNKEEFIKEYKKKKDMYPQYIDDYKQYTQAMKYNNKIDNIIEGVKNL